MTLLIATREWSKVLGLDLIRLLQNMSKAKKQSVRAISCCSKLAECSNVLALLNGSQFCGNEISRSRTRFVTSDIITKSLDKETELMFSNRFLDT